MKKQLTENKLNDRKLLDAVREGYNLPEAYFKVEVNRALKVEDIKTVLNLNQLTGKRFESFYVNTDEIRDGNTVSSLKELLSDPLTPNIKKLFTGFTGAGKTTELIKLYSELEKDCNVIIFSVRNRLKSYELTVEALLFEIVEDVLNFLKVNNLIPENDPDETLKEIIKNIYDWCFETKLIKESNKEETRSFGAGIDLLKGIFFSAKIESKTFGSERNDCWRIIKNKIKDLIFYCNSLFYYLQEKTGKDTVIIIDDIEKISFSATRDFYMENSSLIQDINCKMVMTIPVELIYHSDSSIFQNVFGEAEVLPMIKVRDIDGNEYKKGIDCLTHILERRLDLKLFENECYKTAIKYSGGSIRDLFNIVQRASIIEESDIISEASMKKSVNYHKDMLSNKINERRDEIKITFDEYLDVLFDIDAGNKKSPQKSLALLDLLRTRAVMKYNGEGFYDIHPLLDSFVQAYKEKRRKQNEKEKAGS